jgi:hypothetical protein
MSGQLVSKFKWFWDDADHAIERWLEQMAREGLHLQRVRCLRTVFVFRRGAPAEVSYRIDFLLSRKDPHYVQLFLDAGWEHVDEMLGWQYWRAPLQGERAPEIFTDVESKVRKYKRLLLLFGFAFLPLLLLVPRGLDGIRAESPASLLFLLVSCALGVYCSLRLLLRIRRLRKSEH